MTSVVESWSVGNLSLSVELADKRTLLCSDSVTKRPMILMLSCRSHETSEVQG